MKTHNLYLSCELAFFFFFFFPFFNHLAKRKTLNVSFENEVILGVSTFIQGFSFFFIFVRLNMWRQMLKKNTKLCQNCTRNSETSKKNSKKRLSPQCENSSQKRNAGFNRQKSETKGKMIRLQYLLPVSSQKYTKDD
jgi:hypothetical protein